MKIECQALVIGGGLTGAGILRDLSLRGVDAVLLERRDFNSGASGANHGLLHSGGRYAVNDPESASECVQENAVLKRVASGCIEDTGGLFVALPGDREEYIADFLAACTKIGLEAENIPTQSALDEEPLLNQDIIAAIRVPDASINPFLATGKNLEAAQKLGARVFLHTQVISMKREQGRIVRVDAISSPAGESVQIYADQVVSAAGPWVDQIGAMAGVDLDIAYSKGSLLITNSRLVNHVINRLRPPADGDIVVPGETVTITGTTSIRIKNLDYLYTPAAEVNLLIDEASKLIPQLDHVRYVRAYAGVRPLVQSSDSNGDRGISRTFSIFDHEQDGLLNFQSIAGGKLTTYRLMAEKMCDLICKRLRNSSPCQTADTPLPGSEEGQSLDSTHRLEHLHANAPDGAVLCECEMVSQKEVESIIASLEKDGHEVSPNAIRLRSRFGMGSCQGGGCSMRTIGMMYEKGLVKGKRGNDMLTSFLERRWGGIKPMLWGDQLRQEQFLEALYCGGLNIDGNL